MNLNNLLIILLLEIKSTHLYPLLIKDIWDDLLQFFHLIEQSKQPPHIIKQVTSSNFKKLYNAEKKNNEIEYFRQSRNTKFLNNELNMDQWKCTTVNFKKRMPKSTSTQQFFYKHQNRSESKNIYRKTNQMLYKKLKQLQPPITNLTQNKETLQNLYKNYMDIVELNQNLRRSKRR